MTRGSAVPISPSKDSPPQTAGRKSPLYFLFAFFSRAFSAPGYNWSCIFGWVRYSPSAVDARRWSPPRWWWWGLGPQLPKGGLRWEVRGIPGTLEIPPPDPSVWRRLWGCRRSMPHASAGPGPTGRQRTGCPAGRARCLAQFACATRESRPTKRAPGHVGRLSFDREDPVRFDLGARAHVALRLARRNFSPDRCQAPQAVSRPAAYVQPTGPASRARR